MKLGAADYIAKPLNPDELLGKIKELVHVEEKAPARVPVSSAPDLYIEGQSQAARQLYEHVRLVAPTDMSVLVTGASGTGKSISPVGSTSKVIVARLRLSPWIAALSPRNWRLPSSSAT